MDDSSVSSSKVGASTAGPWFVDVKNGKRSVTIRAGKTGLISIASVSANVDREANARRIVACVNVCVGLPTEALEKLFAAKSGKPIDYVRLKQQRDELATALRGVIAIAVAGRDTDEFIRARAALAKL